MRTTPSADFNFESAMDTLANLSIRSASPLRARVRAGAIARDPILDIHGENSFSAVTGTRLGAFINIDARLSVGQDPKWSSNKPADFFADWVCWRSVERCLPTRKRQQRTRRHKLEDHWQPSNVQPVQQNARERRYLEFPSDPQLRTPPQQSDLGNVKVKLGSKGEPVHLWSATRIC